MRVLSLVCLLLACAVFAVHADEPHGDQLAKSKIELEIRVMEVNVSKLKTFGFDFAAVDALTDGVDGAPVPIVDSGLSSFLEALHREGLVQEDLTFSQEVADGEWWSTAVRWRPYDAKTRANWRHLHLQVCPASVPAGMRLTIVVGAQLSTSGEHAKNPAPQRVASAVELTGQLTLMTPLAAKSLDAPHDQIRLVVFITPRAKSAKQASGKSHPQLLAPRNVLDAHTAHGAPNPDWFMNSMSGEPRRFEGLVDDSLVESEAGWNDTEEIFVTPDHELLDELNARGTERPAPGTFLINPPSKKRQRTRPRELPSEAVFWLAR